MFRGIKPTECGSGIPVDFSGIGRCECVSCSEQHHGADGGNGRNGVSPGQSHTGPPSNGFACPIVQSAEGSKPSCTGFSIASLTSAPVLRASRSACRGG